MAPGNVLDARVVHKDVKAAKRGNHSVDKGRRRLLRCAQIRRKIKNLVKSKLLETIKYEIGAVWGAWGC